MSAETAGPGPIFAILGVLMTVAFAAIGLLAQYFVIKMAAKNALKEYNEEKELRKRATHSSA